MWSKTTEIRNGASQVHMLHYNSDVKISSSWKTQHRTLVNVKQESRITNFCWLQDPRSWVSQIASPQRPHPPADQNTPLPPDWNDPTNSSHIKRQCINQITQT